MPLQNALHHSVRLSRSVPEEHSRATEAERSIITTVKSFGGTRAGVGSPAFSNLRVGDAP